MNAHQRYSRIRELNKNILRERQAEEYYSIMAGITHRYESAAVFSTLAGTRVRKQKGILRELSKLNEMLPMAA
ncbi:hypothetical protein ACFL4G_12700 [Thermodesulfobacteriota bacterium]